jgi:hypothetical protein
MPSKNPCQLYDCFTKVVILGWGKVSKEGLLGCSPESTPFAAGVGGYCVRMKQRNYLHVMIKAKEKTSSLQKTGYSHSMSTGARTARLEEPD